MAGVTVKALRHYDRLGLLKPVRSEAGYRLYHAGDLARLQQIVALKSLGLPLKDIRTLLDRDPLPLAATFRQQREVLEEKRRMLDRAIQALTEAESAVRSGASSTTAILQEVIRVMEMQDVDVMRKYYSDEAWERWKHYCWSLIHQAGRLSRSSGGGERSWMPRQGATKSSSVTRWTRSRADGSGRMG